jgi:hypothetical protein
VGTDVLCELESNAVTGWEAIPVRLHTKHKVIEGEYSWLKIVGNAAARPCMRVVVDPLLPPIGDLKSQARWEFVRNDWDGADLFLAFGDPQWLLATEPAMLILSRFAGKVLEITPVNALRAESFVAAREW